MLGLLPLLVGMEKDRVRSRVLEDLEELVWEVGGFLQVLDLLELEVLVGGGGLDDGGSGLDVLD